jgi:hypothetical protein
MIVQAMLTDLNKLHRECEAASASPDLSDRHEWARGVVHGIKLSIHRVTQHVALPPAMRDQSGKPY